MSNVTYVGGYGPKARRVEVDPAQTGTIAILVNSGFVLEQPETEAEPPAAKPKRSRKKSKSE